MTNEELMRLAVADAARAQEDVPVGAMVLDSGGEVIASFHNQKELGDDPTAHAEVLAIRAAAEALGSWRLDGCKLVVTLEPCVMCAGAIVAARVSEVVFGSFDERVGAGGSLYDILRDSRLGSPAKVTGGVLEAECAELLTGFFESRRD
ncbi:MAG: nucleoside deaminase [Aquiluna sp.]